MSIHFYQNPSPSFLCNFSPLLILFHFSHASSSLFAKLFYKSILLSPRPPLTSPSPSFSPVHPARAWRAFFWPPHPLLITCPLAPTCDTPARAWWAFFWSPQLPVAREYLSPSVMILVLIASSRLKSFPRSMNFWAYSLTSFIKLRNNLGTLTTTSLLAKNHNLYFVNILRIGSEGLYDHFFFQFCFLCMIQTSLYLSTNLFILAYKIVQQES